MRHRLISAALLSTIAASLALVLLAAGCGSGAVSEEQRTPIPEESMPTDLPASLGSTGLECGASFRGTAGGELAVTGRFPTAVSSEEQMVSGTVEVSPTRSDARGVVTPQADAFLVRDGRIVTLPMPQDAVGRQLDLTDGTAEQLPAMASLIPCAGGRPLAAGSYDLYVRVVLNRDDGSRTDSLGGPWPLRVR